MNEAEANRDEAEVSRLEAERQDDPLAEEEAEAAAAEAAEIGGPAPDDPVDDPAERPLVEAGQGESEGFELAEAELIDNASHGDQKRFPNRDASPPEEPTNAAFGEPDEEIPQDADEAIRRNE
ncbi:MAG TPA: hypothetical protein VD741_05165 [Solirubrobacterales bacterium]|nr:hypothetical protein [Solirubrobacterales bacterium]